MARTWTIDAVHRNAPEWYGEFVWTLAVMYPKKSREHADLMRGRRVFALYSIIERHGA